MPEQKPNELYSEVKNQSLLTLLLNSGVATLKNWKKEVVEKNGKDDEPEFVTVFKEIYKKVSGKVNEWTTSPLKKLMQDIKSKAGDQEETDKSGFFDRALKSMFGSNEQANSAEMS